MLTANVAFWDGERDTSYGDHEFLAPLNAGDNFTIFHDGEYHRLTVLMVAQSGRNLSGEGGAKAYYTIRAGRQSSH